MEKLHSFEQYSQVLAEFKVNRARCSTNKMMMRDELSALIEAEKLWFEQIGDTLWFFSDEDYYYSAYLYAPKDTPIQMRKQDKDVLVELMGNASRYNGQMELELVAAGFVKHSKYLEFGNDLESIIVNVRRMNNVMRNVCARQGYTYRTAVKADYPELRDLWLESLGRESYNVTAMTDAELEDMERNGRCVVICDPQGKIVSSSIYLPASKQSNKLAYDFITATLYPGSGLGACAGSEKIVREYEAGYERYLAWVREDNVDALRTARRSSTQTGKFFWQFIYR